MRKIKKEDELLYDFMDENPEPFLGPIDTLPDFETFLKSVEPEKRIIREQIAHRKERRIVWVRRLSVATGVVVVLLLTFTLVPEARAGIRALGTQIVKLFSSESQGDVEFNIIGPNIVLVGRETFTETNSEMITYDFNGTAINLSVKRNAASRFVVSNQEGDVKHVEIYGIDMEYYKDKDGYVGCLIYKDHFILLSIQSDSEELFLQIVKCLQIVHNS